MAMKKSIGRFLGGFALAAACGAAQADNVTLSVFSCDRSYFPKSEVWNKRFPGDHTIRMAGWVEYDVTIEKEGWHELVTFDGGTKMIIWMDGKIVRKNQEDDPADRYSVDGKKGSKIANVYLTAGKHVLKIQSTHYIASQPGTVMLRESSQPNGEINARFVGENIVRLTEGARVSVTAGDAEEPRSYEIVGVCGDDGAVTTNTLATVSFGKGVSTKEVTLRPPSEGVWHLRLRGKDGLSRPGDLGLGRMGVIDTTPVTTAGRKLELLHDIDCVKLTDQGRQLSVSNGFWEAFGQTRVVEAPFGAYREGGDNLDAGIRSSQHGKSKSGFSFDVSVPDVKRPYLLELEYPDDDRRTVNVIIASEGNEHARKNYQNTQLGNGYETGDFYPLSNAMKKYSTVFWADSTNVAVLVMSMNPGMRAAASRIRLWALSDVPGGIEKVRRDGREMALWLEEPNRWLAMTRPFPHYNAVGGMMGQHLLGVKRMAAMAKFGGYTSIHATAACYGMAIWNGDVLEGWRASSFNITRMIALCCEKYGLAFVPELHVCELPYFDTSFAQETKHPEDLVLYSRAGTKARIGDGAASWTAPFWNPLHPDVQRKYLEIVRDLVDSVGDSTALGGVSTRLMMWRGSSWSYLPSINWGYGDWTVHAYEKATGVKVPVDDKDPERFYKRFKFLTSRGQVAAWRKWRTDCISGYQERLRDAIREKHPTAKLYIPYMGAMDGPFGAEKGASARETFEETGIDPDRMRKAEGICVLSSAAEVGRRYSTLLNDFDIHSKSNDPESFTFGEGSGVNANYFEDHTAIPIDLLGFPNLKPGAYCGASEPAGELALDNYAVALAEGDVKAIRFGGLCYSFAHPDETKAWMREFQNLPAKTFTSFEKAIDPVAVRSAVATDEKGRERFYFYAVNRLPYPCSITLALEGVDAVASVATGEAIQLKDGRMTLALGPYGLRAFSAETGARLSDAVTHVPAEVTRETLDMIISMGLIEDQAKRLCGEEERQLFARQLGAAKDAFAKGYLWLARTSLIKFEMAKIYDKVGRWPVGLLHRKGGINKLVTLARERNKTAEIPIIEKEKLLALCKTRVRKVPSEEMDPTWNFDTLYVSEGGKPLRFEIPVGSDGKYVVRIGVAASLRTEVTASVNGVSKSSMIESPGRAEQVVLPAVATKDGKLTVEVSAHDRGLGVYALRIDPVLRPVPSPNWLTAGPFDGYRRYDTNVIHRLMTTDFGPEANPSPTAKYRGKDGNEIGWTYENAFENRTIFTMGELAGTSLLLRNGGVGKQLFYGLTTIDSPVERDVEVEVSSDWMVNLYLNGEIVRSYPSEEKTKSDAKKNGVEFISWYNTGARLHLKEGRNVLLLKVLGGNMSSCFCLWVNDPGDLKIAAPCDKIYKRYTLDNGKIRAEVAGQGYYTGARFDRAGIVTSLRYDGVEYFAKNYDEETRDAAFHDHVAGTAESFWEAVGYREADSGGAFMRIGNGTFARGVYENYAFFKDFDSFQVYDWTEEKVSDRKVVFHQESPDVKGYRYVYTKTIELPDGGNELLVSYELKNTGTRKIETRHYAHNFIAIDGKEVSPDYKLIYPKGTTFSELLNKKLVYWEGNVLSPLKDQICLTQVEGITTAADNVVCVRQESSGRSVTIHENFAPDECKMFSHKRAVCPESFKPIALEPGETARWSRRYTFR